MWKSKPSKHPAFLLCRQYIRTLAVDLSETREGQFVSSQLQEHVFNGHIELQSEMSGVLSGTDAASAWRYNAATTVERTSSI